MKNEQLFMVMRSARVNQNVFILPAFPSSMLFKRRDFVSSLLKRYSVSSISLFESLTVMFKVFPENIFLRPFKKFIFSSSFFSANVLCIDTFVLFHKYTNKNQFFPYKKIL